MRSKMDGLGREGIMSEAHQPSPTLLRPSASMPPEKQVARLNALESEIRLLSEARLAWPRGLSRWWTETFVNQAPFTIIKRKMARFRLPRVLKTDLIDRFCAAEADALESLTTLIVVAHPDDESIGAGARLRHLGDAYVVNITDGAPADLECAQRHGYETREDYAEARDRELRNALAVAGLPDDRLISLGFVDGEATLRLTELCLRITELVDTIHPDVVLTHPYEGGHTDHDATAFAVHLACGILRREGVQPPAVLELTSYHARNGRKVVQQFLPDEHADRDQRVLELNEEDRDVKQRILECFTTQRKVLGQFSTHFEKFRPAPRYVFTKAPHAGLLNYERYGDPERGKTWREEAQHALRLLRMRRD
jgi:LmbE family N-acetylglucosaminyl deacetylase